ncbi:hypothetical protein TRVA0_082S00342 [Trichomonascus vanleenenianus]|uniref:uncharacterized protein n=1 Tax=Trichomonascus vanleenenianus TaxID=2268995 RepID=UPI003EC9BF13
MVNMDSSALAAFLNTNLTNITTTCIDYIIPAGSWHDDIIALLLYCPPYVCAALAYAIASYNPAEAQRRGLWVFPVDILWDLKYLKYIGNGQLSFCNALKQLGWQVVAAATDSWSCHHNNADYKYADEQFKFRDFERHSLPFAWGYIDVTKPEHLTTRVKLNSPRLSCIPVRRGSLEEFLNVGEKTTLRVDAGLCTSSLKTPSTTLEQSPTNAITESPTPTEQRAVYGRKPAESSTLRLPQRARLRPERVQIQHLELAPWPIPAHYEAAQQREDEPPAWPYTLEISVHPIDYYMLILSWRKSILIASGVIGLRIAGMTYETGIGSVLALIICPLVGWFVQSTMVSFDEGKGNILSVLPEVGRNIMLNDSLAEVGGGVLAINVTRISKKKNKRKEDKDKKKEEEEDEGAVEEEEDEGAVEEEEEEEAAEEEEEAAGQGVCQTINLQVQWRKPGLPPHIPWFGVFCGPLFPSLSVSRYQYSIIMVLSGTLSPPVRAKCGTAFGALVVMLLVLHWACKTRGWYYLYVCALSIFLGVFIHVWLALLPHGINVCGIKIFHLSYPDWVKLAELLTFVGLWATTILQNEQSSSKE